jgi:LysM repeat protein
MRTLFMKSGGGIALMRVLLGGLVLAALSATPLSAAAAAPASKGKSQTSPPEYVEHKVTRGETLWRIAQKHKTSVGAIMDYNRMSDQTVREGLTLRIPTPQAQGARAAARQHLHVVKRGETFWGISDDYGISPKLLAEANPNVNPSKLHEDLELVIPAGGAPEVPAASAQEKSTSPAAPPQPGMLPHKVEDNQTYYSIAKQYGITMEAMVAANPQVKPERLRPGMTVQVPMKPKRPATPQDTPQQSNTGSTVAGGTASPPQRTYKIRAGDTMEAIAAKHGVTQEALLKENKLSPSDPFYVEDVLKIPAGGPSTPARTVNSNRTVVQPGEKSGSAPAPSRRQTSAPEPEPEPPSGSRGKPGVIPSYIVSAGEDIATICDAFGITRQQLLDYNRLPANARLKTGDHIMIPKSGE